MGLRQKLKVHPAGLILLVLGLIFWVIGLGGIAACTNDCYNNQGVLKCGQVYQLQWWAVWFEFFLLCIMLGMCFTEAFTRGRLIFLSYLAMVTVLLTISARDFITDTFSNYSGWDVNDTAEAARGAAAAGYVLMCIVNFLLIIFVGLGASTPQQQGYGQFSSQPPPQEQHGYASSAPYKSSPATF